MKVLSLKTLILMETTHPNHIFVDPILKTPLCNCFLSSCITKGKSGRRGGVFSHTCLELSICGDNKKHTVS